MPTLRIKASAVIPAPAPTLYDLIADYRQGHPSILPPQYFENLVVDEGGRGAGTKIHFTMRSFGTRTVLRADITEPEPGRVLVETYPETGNVTRFIVDPIEDRKTRVTFETEYLARGLRGWIEALLVPRFLAKVYAAELNLLARRAVEASRTPRP